jgi:hypothetical protein
LLPIGVNTWLIHQTTQRGPSIGAPALYYMDYNRFNGTTSQLLEFIHGASNLKPVTCPLDDLPCTGGKFQQPGQENNKEPVHRTQLISDMPGQAPGQSLMPSWLIHKGNFSKFKG